MAAERARALGDRGVTTAGERANGATAAASCDKPGVTEQQSLWAGPMPSAVGQQP
jgi:hypothetical protein